MKDSQDIFNAHYAKIRRDPALRQRLIDNPIAGLNEHFGSMPEGNYRVEVIPQEPDTITIVLPAPADGDTSDAAIDAASRRVYDVLFTDGVGGYLIPDEQLTWLLRDMRLLWSRSKTRK
ncbi:MAG: hypothetical protein U1F98_17140 [Verrucomicrobiota bacterium]